MRCLVADALVGMGDTTGAIGLVENPADVEHDSARWWSLHEAFLGPEALPNARQFAWSAPLDRRMACNELPFGEHPTDPLARAVCEMALTRPLPVGR